MQSIGLACYVSLLWILFVSWLGCRMVEGHYLHASVCGFVSITLHKIQQVAWLGNAMQCSREDELAAKRQFKWNSTKGKLHE